MAQWSNLAFEPSEKQKKNKGDQHKEFLFFSALLLQLMSIQLDVCIVLTAGFIFGA